MAVSIGYFASLRPTDTDPATLYIVPAGKRLIIQSINVCNITASAAKFWVGLSSADAEFQDGRMYHNEEPLNGNTAVQVLKGVPVQNDYYIIVASDTADALDFNIHGVLEDI